MQNFVDNFDETKMASKSVKLNQELMDNINRKFLKEKSLSNLKFLRDQLKSIVRKKFTDNKNNLTNRFFLNYIFKYYLFSYLAIYVYFKIFMIKS